MDEKMIPGYLPKCAPCQAYKRRVSDPINSCSISPSKRSKCPCFDCIIIVMCDRCCDSFRSLRDSYE